MKATNTATVQSTQATKVNKVSKPSAKQGKAETVRTESQYTKLVLMTNKALKEESAKLGYCIGQLERLDTLPSKFATYLKQVRKDGNLYKQVENNCRKSKTGRFTAFYLLQYLYKVTK